MPFSGIHAQVEQDFAGTRMFAYTMRIFLRRASWGLEKYDAAEVRWATSGKSISTNFDAILWSEMRFDYSDGLKMLLSRKPLMLEEQVLHIVLNNHIPFCGAT